MKNRFNSRELRVGSLWMGKQQPVRIQSMTNTPTMDTAATVQQILRLVQSGCELVRVTTANVREAENMKNIRKILYEKGVNVPLIADVHFQPKAAERAAKIVEKVRINPGNYTGSCHKNKKYSKVEYQAEKEQISQNLKPLLQICKASGTALRIGINHGSLSDRILFKYGNTAEGMVASAFEFISICKQQQFDALTLSLKASDVSVMLRANRMLVYEMKKQGLDYPIHLGVTEAGNGIEGRIKSAMGIGTLLSEGIGDTIRVSLTEAPEKEIPVARTLVETYGRKKNLSPVQKSYIPFSQVPEELKKSVVSLQDKQNLLPHHTVLLLSYPEVSIEKLALFAAVDFNLAYEHRKPDALLIRQDTAKVSGKLNKLALQILQARGLRYSSTEFVACPSCGRTHFDIETMLNKVKQSLGNRKGLKIAVMGCVVNGPGEMAGADYGFVGSGPGKVSLYKGNTVIFKNLTESEALEKLEELILKR